MELQPPATVDAIYSNTHDNINVADIQHKYDQALAVSWFNAVCGCLPPVQAAACAQVESKLE